MRKKEWLIILSVFLIGFIWGVVSKADVFFAIGGGFGLVAYSLPSTLVIFLTILLLRKIELLQNKPQDSTDLTKPRPIFIIYLLNSMVLGFFIILQKILKLI